ncbi:MAG: primase-like DNA-binding domain-containing protein [Eubacteriales bacterium]
MIFNDQENMFRRQFHEIFCTKYLITCKPEEAVHDDSWSPDILQDILLTLYPSNELTQTDIETILNIGGMYTVGNALCFTYQKETPMFPEMLSAIMPYITTEAFVKFKQSMQGRDADAVANFINCCCIETHEERISISKRDLYDAYLLYCDATQSKEVGSYTFHKRMETLGYPCKKGYLKGKCGVTYYVIYFQQPKWEELKDEADKKRKKLLEANTVRDGEGSVEAFRVQVQGRRNESPSQDTEAEERSIPSRKEQSESTDEHATYVEQHEEPTYNSPTGRITEDEFDFGDAYDTTEDDDVWGDSNADEDDDIPTTRPINESPTDQLIEKLFNKDIPANQRVLMLPDNLRNMFKEAKLLYRTMPSSFDTHSFELQLIMNSVGYEEVATRLVGLFLEYAERKQSNV